MCVREAHCTLGNPYTRVHYGTRAVQLPWATSSCWPPAPAPLVAAPPKFPSSGSGQTTLGTGHFKTRMGCASLYTLPNPLRREYAGGLICVQQA